MLNRKILPPLLGLIGFVSMACAGAGTPAAQPSSSPAEPSQLPTQSDNTAPVSESTPQPSPTELSATPSQTPASTVTPVSPPTPRPPTATPVDAFDRPPSSILTRGWATDFTKHSVAYGEIMSGGPPRDGIPPIDNPSFIPVSDSPEYMAEQSPVISLEINGDVKAYPLEILIWHEIVNDEVGGVPVTVTYCPLCNTAIVFDRRVDGQVLDFGTSGNLRNSDLVMWDRQTESWWQQITGEAIVGELTGTVLTFIPAPLVSWGDFRQSFPDGLLLSRDTGFSRNYGRPPYSGYDQAGNTPFLFSGTVDPRLQAMERVVGISVGDQAVAYPFGLLNQVPVLNDTIGETDIAIFFSDGATSAFAGPGFSDSRTVGATGVYDPHVDGDKLTFKVEGDSVVDENTGSKWNIFGKAIEGPLEGTQLSPVVHANHFWFAWAAFNPETLVKEASDFGG